MLTCRHSYRKSLFNKIESGIKEQFTGIYDVDGKEIYKGDLIEVKKNDTGDHFITEVKWDDDGACFIFQSNSNGQEDLLDSIPHLNNQNYFSYFDYCKVVGNIHEKERK